jgi:starch synthase
MRVLFPVSEAYPLIKTGGLADVAGSLPPALAQGGCDVRLLMPAYRAVRGKITSLQPIARFPVPEHDVSVTILEGLLPGSTVPVWLVDFPPAYDRPGNPYHDRRGRPWPDNAARFALLSRVAARIALGDAGIDWQPDVVHCHDWQTALVPALLSRATRRPATVFTIHNLAYQGLFPHETLGALRLPPEWWSPDTLEFHNHLAFIKGGLVFADRITTVSPTYAAEIQTPRFGHGLDGLLRHRTRVLSGILNGIDMEVWDPQRDPHLVAPFSSAKLAGKRRNKLALQQQCGLPQAADVPLLGLVGRMTEQKGIDLVAHALSALIHAPMQTPFQAVLLGSGETRYEDVVRELARHHPDRIAAVIGYDESLAHRIEAGADMFLMPSRFEPCGLNQLYSLRYGTVPVVHHTGGLADTVIDATGEALENGSANGFVFREPTPEALRSALARAFALYATPKVWQKLIRTGMSEDHSWRTSAEQYLHLYKALLGS